MKGILLLVAYGTVMLVATHIFARKGTASEDFHVGDRHMGVFATAMSVAATWIWAPALFTSAEKAYTSGWPGLFWFLVPNVSYLLLFIPFAKKIRERMPRGITLSGFMESTYEDRNVGRIYRLQLARLFANMDKVFDTPHKKYIACQYRKLFLKVSLIATNDELKDFYEALMAGDPKMRTLRALYVKIFGRYMGESKEAQGLGGKRWKTS